jgi:hypothetical protein
LDSASAFHHLFDLHYRHYIVLVGVVESVKTGKRHIMSIFRNGKHGDIAYFGRLNNMICHLMTSIYSGTLELHGGILCHQPVMMLKQDFYLHLMIHLIFNTKPSLP